jgi:hypothetical protein
MTSAEATLSLLSVFLTAVAALAGYGLLLRRLATLAQPCRLRLAEVGERLLAESVLAPADEAAIRFGLDNAFNGLPVVLAVLLLPAVFVRVLFGSLFGGRSDEAEVPPEQRTFVLCFLASAFAANPLFGTLVATEILVFAAVLLLISGPGVLLRGLLALLRAEAWTGRVYGLVAHSARG